MSISLTALDDGFTGTDADEMIFGLAGNDTIAGSGGDDYINGGAGNDRVTGGAGSDTLHGGSGNDTLAGGTGNDGINGGDGNDRINGGDGSDIMKGGLGNDTFIFVKGEISNGGYNDQIVDFQGAGGHFAVQDFIWFQGFGVGSTFTLLSTPANYPGGAYYELYDPTDGYTATILIQFANADGSVGEVTAFRGVANGATAPTGSDFGWLA